MNMRKSKMNQQIRLLLSPQLFSINDCLKQPHGSNRTYINGSVGRLMSTGTPHSSYERLGDFKQQIICIKMFSVQDIIGALFLVNHLLKYHSLTHECLANMKKLNIINEARIE